MTEPRTLTESLEVLADRTDKGYEHVTDERAPATYVPHAELYRQAQRVARALQEKGLKKGDRVGLILPDSAEFVASIYGVMFAGMIPVPVYPPLNMGQLDAYLSNTTHILNRGGCRLVITDARVRLLLGQLKANAPTIETIETYQGLVGTVDEGAKARSVDVKPDDIAFLQFTSGSTSRPKGVTLTHANLVANMKAIGGGEGIQIREESRGLSWLPLYHDMGLIGFVFTPIFNRAEGVRFMSPLLFLKRPSLWLKHLSEYKAHITFAPNFAYGLATKRIKDKEIEGLDLSNLFVAGCGAEPIQFQTLDGFADRFSSIGFKRTMFLPCYGMAEHSLAVSFTGLEHDLEADRVDPVAFAQGEAKPADEAADDLSVVRVVNCGKAFPEHDIKIVDDEGEALPERRVGNIVLKGPSIMTGYFEDAENTEKALRDGWLWTGDLGYLADGNLFVAGRTKDLIIIHGRNFHPQDIEWQASQVEGVRKGNCIAFGVQDDAAGRERVVVACETKLPRDKHEPLRRAIATQILDGLSLRVDEVVMVEAGSLPKTSSGKLQRSKAAEMFREGNLGESSQASNWKMVKALASSGLGYLRARVKSRG